MSRDSSDQIYVVNSPTMVLIPIPGLQGAFIKWTGMVLGEEKDARNLVYLEL